MADDERNRARGKRRKWAAEMFVKWFKRLTCYFIGHKNVECDRERRFRETYIHIRCSRCGREETVLETEE